MSTEAKRNRELMIEARGLTRCFGSFVAVDNIDVTVSAGEVFGLLGANGAGKTTAIRMLCGTLPPSAGTVSVAGMDMVSHARYARSRLGYVAQRFALYGDLTVSENLRLQAGLYGLSGNHRRERIDWALGQLELAQVAGDMAGELPLGYQRRLALAAALLHRPRVLFLDEPTSGVDPLARQHFWELIYDLADEGIGMLVTTHYMDEALFCDRIALMDAGRITAEDTPAALIERPLPTPMLELRSSHGTALSEELQQWPEVLEIIPHVGQLRVRLQSGSDAEAVMARIRDLAERREIPLESIANAEPELEDVFVSVLEANQQAREEGAGG